MLKLITQTSKVHKETEFDLNYSFLVSPTTYSICPCAWITVMVGQLHCALMGFLDSTRVRKQTNGQNS